MPSLEFFIELVGSFVGVIFLFLILIAFVWEWSLVWMIPFSIGMGLCFLASLKKYEIGAYIQKLRGDKKDVDA